MTEWASVVHLCLLCIHQALGMFDLTTWSGLLSHGFVKGVHTSRGSNALQHSTGIPCFTLAKEAALSYL